MSEIEISIAMINELARKLDTTATYLLGNKSADVHLDCLADIMGFQFQMDQGQGVSFYRGRETASPRRESAVFPCL